jgi:hypothetical protein
VADELNREEKLALLGHIDGRNKDDVDRDLMDMLFSERHILPEDMGDQGRRTIMYFGYQHARIFDKGADLNLSEQGLTNLFCFGSEMLKIGLIVGHRMTGEQIARLFPKRR